MVSKIMSEHCCLVPSLLVRSDVDPTEKRIDGMLHWQVDLSFPKSGVRRWQSVWQSKYQEMEEGKVKRARVQEGHAQQL